MEKNKGKIFLNTVFWGFILWLFGYILGIVFFAFMPQDMLGWFIMPFGIIFTLWVLFKKIQRQSFGCYVALGVIWTLIAVVLDYLFIVLLFKSTNYYKLDVDLYYVLTFALPVAVGWYLKSKGRFSKVQN
ncbi:MAG: hypothetical protein ABIB04_04165 [Patescibacteria group bacterium]